MVNRLSRKEVGQLGYYDCLAYIGLPFIHWGGMKATEELLKLCNVTENSQVLVVGCGSGFTSIQVAETFGCQVMGIDISEQGIAAAKERAKKSSASDKVTFKIGSAYQMPFEDNRFEIAISEFVLTFLDKDRIMKEVCRVLEQGGRLGINELVIAENIPQKPRQKIVDTLKEYSDMVELNMEPLTANQWKNNVQNAGFDVVKTEEMPAKEARKPDTIKALGKAGFIKYALRAAYYYTLNSNVRKYVNTAKKLENILLWRKEISQYVGNILAVGTKIS
ncbi:MAG: methyltransferase domain-containing protein [Candidatus Odinarchaeota archaeon]